MSYALYITHPEVVLDPQQPPTRWHLSPRGRERAAAFGQSALMRSMGLIISSPETKTMEMAGLLAAGRTEVVTGEDTHENVRHTGVATAERFEQMMDALYAAPEISTDGWETLKATEERIVAAVRAAIARHADRAPLAFVGHGTVGAVLKCHLAGRTPTRDEDQRRMADPSGGNVFVFRLADMSPVSDWVAMETIALGLPGSV